MSTLQVLNELVALINAVIPATLDPRDVNPPCAWIAARSCSLNHLGGYDPELTADVFLVSPDSGAVDAHRILGDLLDKVLEHLDATGVAVVNAIDLDAAITLPIGGSPQPAYRVNLTY